MSLPIYQEIVINEPNHEKIFQVIAHAPIGRVPCYCSLDNIADEDKGQVIESIYQCFLTLGISDSFPYPTYILSHIKNDDVPIRQFATKSLMPRFFMNRTKRLNPKEGSIFNKNQLKYKQLENLIVPEKMTNLHAFSQVNLALKTAVDETDFYTDILNNLKIKSK